MQTKTITNFMDKEYRDFSYYTIENRAIPSCIDGLKPSARKIIYVSEKIWKNGNNKFQKVFQLAGRVASDAFYHHGDASLQNAIITMCQKFKNNLPLLEGDGILGFLRATQSGAPRYVGARLSDNFRLLYKDFDLLESKMEEGNVIEPNYYLPIIPTVLINGSIGLSVGFSSNIINRDPICVIDNCINILEGTPFVNIEPKIDEFNGEWIRDTNNSKRWIIRGKFKRINSTTVQVVELPPSMTYEKYDNVLDELLSKKLIVSYDDNCKNNIDYIIKFNKESLAKYTDDELIKFLKLEEYITEAFTTLDENGKLKIFENDFDIVNYFVNFRVLFYNKRKEKELNELFYKKMVLSNKGKFIKMVLESKIEIKNKSKKEIETILENYKFIKIEDSYDYLLKMPIYSLTIDLFEKLKDDFTMIKKEIEIKELEVPKETYIKELKELKKKLK